MKLTPWSELVKPQRQVFAVAAVTTLVTVLALQLLLGITDREQARMDRYGDAAAGALARLAVEPLMRQDRLHLGVIGNRLARLPEITGVASSTAENEQLASTGELLGHRYTQPVAVDGTIIGYVTVALQPRVFAGADPDRALGMLLIALLTPLLVAIAWTFAQAAHRGELAGRLPGRPQWIDHLMPAPGASAGNGRDGRHPGIDVEPPPPAPAPDIPHYLLAVNLYNQITLDSSEREFELSLCLELADAVATLYQGRASALPGVGALVDFEHVEDPDRPFQIVCAAMVLARLLRDEAPFGTYRLGLNMVMRPPGESVPPQDDAVADAALLSALAKEATLPVSESLAITLSNPEGMVVVPIVNPLLDELATGAAGCQLVTELRPPYVALVAQQAEQLKGQRDAISSPSTF